MEFLYKLKDTKLYCALTMVWSARFEFLPLVESHCVPGGVRVFSRCSSGKGGPGPGISHCIPVTSFGFLYRLESLQYHQKKCFCDFPITLIPSSMSCSQAMAKLSGQKPASIRALKYTRHVLSHGEFREWKTGCKRPRRH